LKIEYGKENISKDELESSLGAFEASHKEAKSRERDRKRSED
jgi:hypothetical protein